MSADRCREAIYFIRRWWHQRHPLPLWCETCPDCNGAGGSHYKTGDGFHEPEAWDYDPCESCANELICASCATQLNQADGDLVYADGKPCPFCGWTIDLGFQREIEDSYEPDYDGESE